MHITTVRVITAVQSKNSRAFSTLHVIQYFKNNSETENQSSRQLMMCPNSITLKYIHPCNIWLQFVYLIAFAKYAFYLCCGTLSGVAVAVLVCCCVPVCC